MADYSNQPVRGTGGELDDAERLGGDLASNAEDPAAIRAEIRDTRERVGDTLEQIGERLNPNHLKEQVRENVSHIKDQVRENIRDATIGRVEHMAQNAANRVNETRMTIADTVRENPIPAAMVGIGLGWLFMNRRQGGASHDADARYSGGVRYGASAGGARGAYGSYGGYGGAGSGGAGYAGTERYAGSGSGEESGALDRARDAVGDLGHTVRDTAGQLADRAQDVAGSVAHRAQDMASTVADQTRTQARRVEDRFYESPLAVGAATLALGLAAGLSLPATHAEVELMGDARDRIVDRAKDVAQDTTEKVQHVAERVISETKSTVADSARQEGLTR